LCNGALTHEPGRVMEDLLDTWERGFTSAVAVLVTGESGAGVASAPAGATSTQSLPSGLALQHCRQPLQTALEPPMECLADGLGARGCLHGKWPENQKAGPCDVMSHEQCICSLEGPCQECLAMTGGRPYIYGSAGRGIGSSFQPGRGPRPRASRLLRAGQTFRHPKTKCGYAREREELPCPGKR